MRPATSPAPRRRASRRPPARTRRRRRLRPGSRRARSATTSATLSWTASTDDVGVTGYRLFQDGIQVGTSTTTSYSFTGLTCATTYTLGVAAVDAAGNVSGTATMSVTTAACPDTTPPSTPTGLATSAVGPDLRDPLVDGLDRQRRRHRLPAVPERQPGRDLDDHELQLHGTHLRYDLHARRRRGRRCRQRLRAPQRRASPTVGLPGHDAAVNPDGSRRRARSGRPRRRSSWTASTDNVGVTGYRVFQGSSQVGTPATTSFGFTGLTCGTTYTLGVAAVDAAGNVSGTATKSVTTTACPDTTPPSTPTGLATSAISQTSATLSWTASTDNVGVTGYQLFRDGTQVGTSATTSYSYTGLTCATTYTLGVAAVDAAGNVSGTATKSVTTAACPDTTAPSTPTGLATSAVGATSATLSWTASTDNVAVTGYRLFQGGSQVGTSAHHELTTTPG